MPPGAWRTAPAPGFEGAGWDPIHRPHSPINPAPVVNLGYVVNVIEKPQERLETLKRAWSLAERILIVSARLVAEAQSLAAADGYADGCLTSRGTFQKFFEQQELKTWIDQSLGVSSLPAGPGIFYVFCDEEERSAFMASRFRRHIVTLRLARSIENFEQHRQLLQPLMDFVARRGRRPADDELPNTAALQEVFGTIRRSFRVIVRHALVNLRKSPLPLRFARHGVPDDISFIYTCRPSVTIVTSSISRRISLMQA